MTATEDYAAELEEHRREKDRFFAEHPRSPIPPDRRDDFDGLEYFPVDESLRFVLELHEHDDPERITAETTHEGENEYVNVGEFRFELEGEPVSLQAYRRVGEDDGGLWVPFRDATSGDETYGAGRYLDLVPSEDRTDDGRWVVDLNRAYSPFCAYSDQYECPLVPGENWLQVPVRAGEKDPGL